MRKILGRNISVEDQQPKYTLLSDHRFRQEKFYIAILWDIFCFALTGHSVKHILKKHSHRIFISFGFVRVAQLTCEKKNKDKTGLGQNNGN